MIKMRVLPFLIMTNKLFRRPRRDSNIFPVLMNLFATISIVLRPPMRPHLRASGGYQGSTLWEVIHNGI